MVASSVIRPADDASDNGLVLITGAAGGVGSACARRAGRGGAPIGLIDVDGDRVNALADELADTGSKVYAAGCDVGDESGLEAAVEAACAELGAPTGLVTAAGIDRATPLQSTNAAAWDEVIGANLRGTFIACRAVLGRMVASGGGAIVCVSSPLARVSTPGGSAAYAASKAGVCALVRSIAIDHASQGVRANAVLPGPTETALMWANVSAADIPHTRELISGEVPLGRLATPDEIAAAIEWLLSDEASFVTGSELVCDGGVLARASVSV
jgi:NAD(P)-dependent dehydrogenase (short-subunit alcohol dehydrogenase family)